MGKLRKSSSVFSQGKYRCLVHDKGMYVFERFNDEMRLIIAVNISSNTVTLNLKENMMEYGKKETSSSFNIKSNEYLILRTINY
ncbi:hypothetical protein SDC9_131456 [bioreactor metagenome]